MLRRPVIRADPGSREFTRQRFPRNCFHWRGLFRALIILFAFALVQVARCESRLTR